MADFKMTVPSGYDVSVIEHHTLQDFVFTSDPTPRPITVAFRQFNRGAAKKALVPTCFGGRINDTAEALHFASRSLSDHHVVAVAILGNGESSSPSNTPDFPTSLDYRDCVAAQYRLLTEALGFEWLDVVLGFSMGGQQAYYWARAHQGFVRAAVSICSSARTSAHNYAFLAGPEAALACSADYASFKAAGTSADIPLPAKGLAAFGRAWCAWGTGPAWFRAGLWRDGGKCASMAEWLVKHGERSFIDWHPDDLLVHLRMWQRGDVGVLDPSGDYTRALADIRCPVLVMPSSSDAYFPPEDSEEDVKHLKHGTLKVLDTVWGHIAGGGANPADMDWLDAQIKEFLGERSQY